jgi:hypothetical protein
MKKIFFILITSSFLLNTLSSQIAPGQWRDHLTYTAAKQIVIAGQKIYCATNNSLFYYNLSDNSVNKLSKVNGLNDVNISAIGYSESSGIFIIAYDNSNIDLIKNTKIINIPDIKNKISIPDKQINSIYAYNNNIYLSSDFGIVVIDPNKAEIKDTYLPGENGNPALVYNVTSDSEYIYAATSSGIYEAELNDPFLVNYSHWIRIQNIPYYNKEFKNIEIFGNKLFVVNSTDLLLYYNDNGIWKTIDLGNDKPIKSIVTCNNQLILTGTQNIYSIDKNLILSEITSTKSPNYAVIDNNNTVWIADEFESLIKLTNGNKESVSPNGPMFKDVVKIDAYNGQAWAAGGGKDPLWASKWLDWGVYAFIDNVWYSFNRYYLPEFNNARDFINVKINPLNPSKVYLAAWTGWTGDALFEITNKKVTAIYTPTNSPLQFSLYWNNVCKTYGLSFDKSGNLWVVNSSTARPISVLKTNGTWSKSLSFKNSLVNVFQMSYILCTSLGPKWCITRSPNGIFIFDDHNTIDDETKFDYKFITLPTIDGNSFANVIINSIAEDKNGIIWIGTSQGPLIFTDPQDYKASDFSPSLIKVPISPGSTQAAYLLFTEVINSITVDGANRKWIGTQNSGAYLFSEDGTKQLLNFTTQNSPLLSNTVYDIAIDNKSGEVFFATENGIISYRGYATEATSDFGKVYTFPNPVPHNYSGDIIITGLAEDVNVKITDVSGNLVYETTSLGGQAVWNGKTLSGRRVNTGVYLVFCTNDDGSKTFVTKLLFIR